MLPKLTCGVYVVKTLKGSDLSSARIELDVGEKGPTCDIDMTVIFDPVTGLASKAEGSACDHDLSSYGLDWYVPGFFGEELLEHD